MRRVAALFGSGSIIAVAVAVAVGVVISAGAVAVTSLGASGAVSVRSGKTTCPDR